MGFFFTLHLWRITVLILICAGMAGAASAVVITESPSHVMRGDPITIDIAGLSDNSEFSLLLKATLEVTPGQDFLFETTNFVMPISLSKGQISATTTGAQQATFSAKKGGTEVSVTRSADANGVFSFSQAQDIPAGTFDFISLQGTPLPDKTMIVSSIQLRGKKTGPDTSHITFTVNGIDNGMVQLTVFVDGTQALSQTVTIGEGITSVRTTVAPKSDTGITANVTTTTTPAPTTTVSNKTFFSADRNVSLTAQGTEYAGLVWANATGVPGDWIRVGDAYRIAPDSLSFSPAATIIFRLPEQVIGNSSYFVASYTSSKWVIVPGTAQNNTTISADISKAGTFALMTYKPESSMPVSGTERPAGTIMTGDASANASGAQETLPTPAATKTPISIMPVFGALAIGIGIVFRKTK
jgi:hypothetical protein